jgi:hypothetical protein
MEPTNNPAGSVPNHLVPPLGIQSGMVECSSTTTEYRGILLWESLNQMFHYRY